MNGLTRDWRGWVFGCTLLGALAFVQSSVRAVGSGATALVPSPPPFIGLSIDPRVVRRLLGTRLLVADVIWIDTLMKSDVVREDQPFTAFYRAFKNVVALDPDNLYAYYVAGIYLSVVKDDIKGATAILRDGVDYMVARPGSESSWPNAWRLPFSLGYNLLFEEHEIEAGSRWVRYAAGMPEAPRYVRDLGERVSTEKGMLEVASRVLVDSHKRMAKPEQRQKIEKKMLDLAVRQELVDLNERFRHYLEATGAYAFQRQRAFQLFRKANSHSGKDMLGRTLEIDSTGRIAPRAQ